MKDPKVLSRKCSIDIATICKLKLAARVLCKSRILMEITIVNAM